MRSEDEAVTGNGTKPLADELIRGLQENLPAAALSDGLWSVCVCGSYVRGDFMDCNSDLDFCLIGKPESGECPHGSSVRELVDVLLHGRSFHSHNPHQFDWITVSWDALPKPGDLISLPESGPSIRLLNIFLFDFVEHLLVLCGEDPRRVLAEPPSVRALALAWFTRACNNHEHHLKQHAEYLIPMTAFNSIHVAQIVFGERTLDKRRLLDLYRRHVPGFPLKDFGAQMIQAKLQQRYPDHPPVLAPWQRYLEFERQLAGVVERELTGQANSEPTA